MYLRTQHDHKFRRIVRHRIISPLYHDQRHRPEHHGHRKRCQRDQRRAPSFSRFLSLKQPQRRQHRRKKQQAYAGHTDVVRKHDVHDPKHGKKCRKIQKRHAPPSSFMDSVSHRSIISA